MSSVYHAVKQNCASHHLGRLCLLTLDLTVPPRRTVGTCGLSLCAVITLQLLYGTLHIMVPTQLMCTHNHTTVGQYTTPTDEISQPNPRGTRAHAPLLPRGGEGGRAVLEPLFSQEGFCFWDIGKPPPGRCYLSCPCERACAHFFAPPPPTTTTLLAEGCVG